MKQQKSFNFSHIILDAENPEIPNDFLILDVEVASGCGRNHILVLCNNNFKDKNISFEIEGAEHQTELTLYPPFHLDMETEEVLHIGNPTEHFVFDLFLERDVGSFKVKADNNLIYALTWAYADKEWTLLDTHDNRVNLDDDDENTVIPSMFARLKKHRDHAKKQHDIQLGGVVVNNRQ